MEAEWVSVPYRGATFLNSQLNLTNQFLSSFRPLSGSYISQSGVTAFKKMLTSVSVPYRGATFLNRSCTHDMMEFNIVSVPYRGATFLNEIMNSLKEITMKGFRPLSGSYISQYCKPFL